MKRLLTDQCRKKGCPYLVWERYLTTIPPRKLRRRGVCVFIGKQPGNMYFCPLEEELKKRTRGGIFE